MILLYLFLEFFKIGLFTFGGGQAMIPLLRETVLKYGWISEEGFYDFIGLCESTPGPIAVNMATYVGNSQAGILGAIIATLAVILPSFIIILVIAAFLAKLTQTKVYRSIMKGIHPVVAALLICTGLLILTKNVIGTDIQNPSFNLNGAICFILIVGVYFLFKLLFKKKINNILLIGVSAAFGLIIGIVIG